MTYGEMLYLILVVATFGSFGLFIGYASWLQTKQDRQALAARRTRPAE